MSSTSRRDVDRQNNKRMHFSIVRFMLEAGAKLRMTSIPLATAATIYHRFFRDFAVDDFDPHMIAITCLYLAGKIEEEHVRLTDIINVTYRTLHPEKPALEIGSTYWTLRDSVIQCELFVARALQFDFAVEHPHKGLETSLRQARNECETIAAAMILVDMYLVHYLKSIYDWLDRRTVDRTPIAATSWALLSDSYHGTLCLSHRPDVIAIAVLHIALQSYGVDVPPHDANETKCQWWEALIDDVRWSDIKRVVNELLDLYDLETVTEMSALR